MIVGIKDALKLFGVSIISCCAVLVCNMFINYYLDLQCIKDIITSPPAIAMCEAQALTSKVTVLVTGGCLLATSIVTLLFHVKHFIDKHKKKLGILKAFGYSDIKLALSFWTFGLSVFWGSAIGFALAFAIMPAFYNLQNSADLLPNIPMRFHAEILAYLVILPTVAFSVISVLYAAVKLKQPVLGLIKDDLQSDRGKTNRRMRIKARTSNLKSGNERPFLRELAISTLKTKKTLTFFVWFASFCFSAMTQMSISMKDLSSAMMAAMMMVVGLTLAFTTLILAITTVIDGNSKTIATMRAMGYSQAKCVNAVLGGYRPFAYVGFAIGTAYQYGLLKFMVSVVFKNISSIPEYKFDWKVMLISLAVFIVVYEIIMLCCADRIRKIPMKFMSE